MKVKKRDETIEEFNIDKIQFAVQRAFESVNMKVPQYLVQLIDEEFSVIRYSLIGIEEIQNKVERLLMEHKIGRAHV